MKKIKEDDRDMATGGHPLEGKKSHHLINSSAVMHTHHMLLFPFNVRFLYSYFILISLTFSLVWQKKKSTVYFLTVYFIHCRFSLFSIREF